MKTITATDANRKFSKLLKDVSHGQVFTVVSRGRPVAIISPFKADTRARQAAKKRLIERLNGQKVIGKREWSRNELYE